MLLSAVIALIWFGAVAMLGTDGHHHGYIARPAVDVLNGRALFVETWTWYGPLHAYLNAAGLWLLGERLFSIQSVTVVGYAVSSAALWYFWRQIGGTVAAWLGIAVFVLSAPEVVRDGALRAAGHPTWVQEPALLPWPSVWALAFTVTGFILYLRALESERLAARVTFLAGVATGLGAATRLPTGIAALSAIVLSSVALRVWGQRDAFRLATMSLLGAAAAVFVVYLPTLVEGGIRAAWEDQVMAPRRWAGSRLDSSLYAIARGIWSSMPFAFLLSAISAAAILARRVMRPSPLRRVLALNGILILGVVAACIALMGWPTLDRVMKAQGRWSGALVALTIVGVCGGALAAVCLVVRTGLRTSLPAKSKPIDLRLPAAAFLASSGLVQLIPVFESRHIWWSTAPLIGVAFSALLFLVPEQLKRVVVTTFCIAFLPLAIATAYGYQARQAGPWVDLGGVPFLDGMKVRPELARELRPLVQEVDEARAARPDVPVLALGYNALFGLIGGSTDPPNPYSIVWAEYPDPPSIAKYIKRRRPVIWLETFSTPPVRAYARSIEYCIAQKHEPTIEHPIARFVLLPCPGPDPSKLLEWHSGIGPAPPWAEIVR